MPARFGINPSPLAPIGTELPLADVAKQAVTGPNGVTSLVNASPHYPAGSYRLRWSGTGAATLYGSAAPVAPAASGAAVPVDPARGPLLLRTAGDVRDVAVVMPAASTEGWPWNPAWLALWAGRAGVLRCMPWQKTMVSLESEWADRALVSDQSYAPKGMPLEMCLDATSRLGADPWLNVPARASDDYVRKMCELIDAEMRGPRVYVEYSNETWNLGYPAGAYALARAGADGLTDPAHPYLGLYRWAARRTAAVATIARAVLGPRVVCVLGSQASNPWVTQQMVAAVPAGAFDLVAVAPYVRGPAPAAAAGWTLDPLFGHLTGTALPAALAETAAHAAAAKAAGYGLAVYEAGVSLVAGGSNPALLALYEAAGLDGRMGALHAAYLDGLEKAGASVACYLNTMGPWSGSGCWSLLRWHGDSTPKYDAAVAWAAGRA
jgi:hypothetical protein